jgi:hypothetical protein
VLEIRLADGSVLHPTVGHPLYSATRDDWVAAGMIEFGEQLLTKTGFVRVAEVIHLPNSQPVHNLEIEFEHCYYTGAAEILSHNGCLSAAETAHQGRSGYGNYTLSRDGKVYYHGMHGPKQNLADVVARHSRNHNRFDPNLDKINPIPGKRSYGDARRMEHEGILRDGTFIGRKPGDYRGNRQMGISDRRLSAYYPDC